MWKITLLLMLATTLGNCIYSLQSQLRFASEPQMLMPPEEQMSPEIGLALTFTPDPILINEEVRFSIWTSAGQAASGGTMIVGIEKSPVPMSSMEMMGDMTGAVELGEGNYVLGLRFQDDGDYIIHVHFVPAGASMAEMMKNHADFGPLHVSRTQYTKERPERVDVVMAAGAYVPGRVEGFVPEELTIKAGTTVTWKNSDASSHTVTERESGLFTSPLLNPGDTWSYTFDKPGVYRYQCNPHLWMEGTIIVK